MCVITLFGHWDQRESCDLGLARHLWTLVYRVQFKLHEPTWSSKIGGKWENKHRSRQVNTTLTYTIKWRQTITDRKQKKQANKIDSNFFLWSTVDNDDCIHCMRCSQNHSLNDHSKNILVRSINFCLFVGVLFVLLQKNVRLLPVYWKKCN